MQNRYLLTLVQMQEICRNLADSGEFVCMHGGNLFGDCAADNCPLARQAMPWDFEEFGTEDTGEDCVVYETDRLPDRH